MRRGGRWSYPGSHRFRIQARYRHFQGEPSGMPARRFVSRGCEDTTANQPISLSGIGIGGGPRVGWPRRSVGSCSEYHHLLWRRSSDGAQQLRDLLIASTTVKPASIWLSAFLLTSSRRPWRYPGECLHAWFALGIPSDWNQLAYCLGHVLALMTRCASLAHITKAHLGVVGRNGEYHRL
jgi:hypothetical protein